MNKQRISEDVEKGLSGSKYGTTWLMYLKVGKLINFSEFSRFYFGKSAQWFLQRLHGNKVHNKRVAFTPEQYDCIANSLRHLATQLNTLADNIDKAEYYDIND